MDKTQPDEPMMASQPFSHEKKVESSWFVTALISAVTAVVSLVPSTVAAVRAIKNKTRIQLPFIHASLALLGTFSTFFTIFAFKEAIKARSQNDKAEKRSGTAVDLTEEPTAFTPASLRESAEDHCRWQSSIGLSKDASNLPVDRSK